jgi:hypothetical protein
MGSVNDVAYTSDARRLLGAGGDKRLLVWNAVTGQVVHTLTGHTNAVGCVCCSPLDEASAVSAGEDRCIKVWGRARGGAARQVHPATHDAARPHLACSPGRAARVCGVQRVRLAAARHRAHTRCGTWSAATRRAASRAPRCRQPSRSRSTAKHSSQVWPRVVRRWRAVGVRRGVAAVPCCAVLCCAALRRAAPCCAALRCAVLRCAALCCAVLCSCRGDVMAMSWCCWCCDCPPGCRSPGWHAVPLGPAHHACGRPAHGRGAHLDPGLLQATRRGGWRGVQGEGGGHCPLDPSALRAPPHTHAATPPPRARRCATTRLRCCVCAPRRTPTAC